MADYSDTSTAPWYSVYRQIKSVVINDGVTHIGDYAFINCTALTSVDISDHVVTIGIYAFRNCISLESVTIPDSVTSIDGTFYGCTFLASVTIGSSVQTIGSYAFYNCTKLASVAIPDSVTTIGDWAFSRCTSLTSVTIGNSVTSIGQGVFNSCTSLVNIFFLTTTWNITSIGSNAFSLGTSSASVSATVHSPNNVANGRLDTYKGDYTTLTYVASMTNTYTINVNDATYGSVSPISVQIYDGTSVDTDGNRLVFSDGQTVTATPA